MDRRLRDNLALVVGPSDVGKSWLACAIGQKACRGRPFPSSIIAGPSFCEDLALARGDGRHPRLIKSLGRADLLILDDFGLEPLDAGAPVMASSKSSRSDTAAGPRSSPLSFPCPHGMT